MLKGWEKYKNTEKVIKNVTSLWKLFNVDFPVKSSSVITRALHSYSEKNISTFSQNAQSRLGAAGKGVYCLAWGQRRSSLACDSISFCLPSACCRVRGFPLGSELLSLQASCPPWRRRAERAGGQGKPPAYLPPGSVCPSLSLCCLKPIFKITHVSIYYS